MDHNPFYTPLDHALFKRRIVQISGPVGSQLAYDVNKTLLAMETDDPVKPVVMLINSPGGEITSGFSIYDTARFIAPKVYTVICGLAASMGSLIALCSPKERRFATPNSKFLIHQPLISGVLQGSASELEIHAKDIMKTREKINRLYAEETGREVAEVEKATDRDNWMDATEAKNFGLIKGVINHWKDLPGL